MKKFKAKKKGFFIFILLTGCIPLYFLFLNRGNLEKNWFDFTLSALPFLMLLWIYYTTRYWIEQQQLHYRSAFIKGKIDIATITSIQVGKTLWVGLKPALAKKGIIIAYNSYDEIYLAPLDNEELVNELVKINPNIVRSNPTNTKD